MNIKRLYRKIKVIQEQQWRTAVTYQTVRNQLLKWTKIDDIIKIKAWSWWKREVPWNKWCYKLSERDLERAKYMFNTWMNIKELTKYFQVSKSYFNYHNIF